MPIPVAVGSEAKICGCSNAADVVDVRLMCWLFVVLVVAPETGLSFVQRSPAVCVCLTVIYSRQQ
jgi:hypothetical protein